MAGSPASSRAATSADFQENYLRHVFGFIGIHDVEFVRAEGLNLGAEQRAAALARAHERVAEGMPIAA